MDNFSLCFFIFLFVLIKEVSNTHMSFAAKRNSSNLIARRQLAASVYTFNYNPLKPIQNFTTPPSILAVTVTISGGRGGKNTNPSYPCTGGKGGTITATFGVNPNTIYYVFLGGSGVDSAGECSTTAI